MYYTINSILIITLSGIVIAQTIFIRTLPGKREVSIESTRSLIEMVKQCRENPEFWMD